MLTDTIVVSDLNASHDEVPIGILCIACIELRHEHVELGWGKLNLYGGSVLKADGECEITLLRTHHIDVVLHEYGIDLLLGEAISLLDFFDSVGCKVTSADKLCEEVERVKNNGGHSVSE